MFTFSCACALVNFGDEIIYSCILTFISSTIQFDLQVIRFRLDPRLPLWKRHRVSGNQNSQFSLGPVSKCSLFDIHNKYLVSHSVPSFPEFGGSKEGCKAKRPPLHSIPLKWVKVRSILLVWKNIWPWLDLILTKSCINLLRQRLKKCFKCIFQERIFSRVALVIVASLTRRIQHKQRIM